MWAIDMFIWLVAACLELHAAKWELWLLLLKQALCQKLSLNLWYIEEKNSLYPS